MSIHYIGKESNELDESEIIGVESNNYTEFTSMEAVILELISLSPKEAQKLVISKSQYYEILKRYKQGEQFKLNGKTIIKLRTG